MSITGLPDEARGRRPMRAGVAVVDLFTGMYTANAILAALVRRGVTGRGRTIDSALFDCGLAMLANQASNYLVSGDNPPRQGNTHPNIVPYQPFACADQPLIIAVGNDRQFAASPPSSAHPEWATNERFATNAARIATAPSWSP
jgi:crotonobetainyl-CoA:carnitine CoA-transferase CaiB-like acyl-CoA transferase